MLHRLGDEVAQNNFLVTHKGQKKKLNKKRAKLYQPIRNEAPVRLEVAVLL